MTPEPRRFAGLTLEELKKLFRFRCVPDYSADPADLAALELIDAYRVSEAERLDLLHARDLLIADSAVQLDTMRREVETLKARLELLRKAAGGL